MKHAKRLLSPLLALLLALGCAPLALGEATPGEAERCDHANATVTVTETNAWYKSVDARSHIKGYDEVTTVDCPDCDEGDSESVVYKQLSEAHAMKDGVCTLCGYEAPKATPTPKPTAKPTPKPTVKPTATPTAKPTATPTAIPAPTAAPTAAPVPEMPELVSALFDAADALMLSGNNVSIAFAGEELIFTQEELAALSELELHERILITLSAAGMADLSETALAAMQTDLSDAAKALDQRIVERMLALSEQEQAELNAALDAHFPITETELDGKIEPVITFTLIAVVDGEEFSQSLSFVQNLYGDWMVFEAAQD